MRGVLGFDQRSVRRLSINKFLSGQGLRKWFYLPGGSQEWACGRLGEARREPGRWGCEGDPGGSPLARRRLQSRMVSWSRKRRETQGSPSSNVQERHLSAEGERRGNGGENMGWVTLESGAPLERGLRAVQGGMSRFEAFQCRGIPRDFLNMF